MVKAHLVLLAVFAYTVFLGKYGYWLTHNFRHPSKFKPNNDALFTVTKSYNSEES
jgi:hypothetical protein